MRTRCFPCVFLLLLALTGCAAPPRTLGGLACPSDFCRRVDPTAALYRDCAVQTSRRVQDFAGMSLSMSFAQLCARVGRPDWDAGSGLMIAVYDLADGTRVLAGFAGPEQMVYLQQMLADGTSRALAGP